MMNYTVYQDTPLGVLQISGTEDFVTEVDFVEKESQEAMPSPVLVAAAEQIQSYFDGGLERFDLPLQLQGSGFRVAVWQHLQEIPYGTMVSYQSVAETLGNPKSVRAVGAANGQNPIAIVVPCHRVVGSDGKLVGYVGGLWRKE